MKLDQTSVPFATHPPLASERTVAQQNAHTSKRFLADEERSEGSVRTAQGLNIPLKTPASPPQTPDLELQQPLLSLVTKPSVQRASPPTDTPPLTPEISLQNLFFSSGRCHKVRLDGPQIQSILGERSFDTLLQLWQPINQKVNDCGGERMALRPFRASILTGTHAEPPILMGPTRAAGGYGKLRDALLLREGGTAPAHFVLKELRTRPAKPRLDASGNNVKDETKSRFNRERTLPMPNFLIDREQWLASELGGALRCIGRRDADDKVYLIFKAADCDLFEAAEQVNYRQLSALARHVAGQYAQHLRMIHRKNFIHIDGKLENVAMNLTNGSVALMDFGAALEVNKKTKRCEIAPRNFTHISPESVRQNKLSFPHDVWCMGITLLQVLGCIEPILNFSRKNENQKNREILSAFCTFREQMMSDSDEGRFVDIKKLRTPTESVSHRALLPAIRNDAGLTAYILQHLLDPDPKSRHSASAAATCFLNVLHTQENDSTMRNIVLPQLAQKTKYLLEPPLRLEATRKMLLGICPEAFSHPGILRP